MLPSSSVVGVIVSGTIGAPTATASGVSSIVIGMYLRLPLLSAGPTIGFVSAARRLINFAARAPEIFKSRCNALTEATLRSVTDLLASSSKAASSTLGFTVEAVLASSGFVMGAASAVVLCNV